MTETDRCPCEGNNPPPPLLPEPFAEEVDCAKKRNKVMEEWFWAWFWRDLAGPIVLVMLMFTCLWLCLAYNPNYLLVVFCFCFGLTPCLPVLFWPMLASLFLLVIHGWAVTDGDMYMGWSHNHATQ